MPRLQVADDQYRLGPAGELTWWPALAGAIDTALDRRVDTELASIYRDVVAALTRDRASLDAIADALVEGQELTGAELQSLANDN